MSARNQRPDSLALCEVLMKAGDRVHKADVAHVGSSGAFSASTPHQRHLQGLQLTKSRQLLSQPESESFGNVHPLKEKFLVGASVLMKAAMSAHPNMRLSPPLETGNESVVEDVGQNRGRA